MRKLFWLSLVALAGCGVDGEPVQPTLNTTIGISGSGGYVAGAVGLHQGPISVFFGF